MKGPSSFCLPVHDPFGVAMLCCPTRTRPVFGGEFWKTPSQPGTLLTPEVLLDSDGHQTISPFSSLFWKFQNLLDTPRILRMFWAYETLPLSPLFRSLLDS